MKKFLIIILALLPISVYSDDGGSCGENAIWTYTESTHTLTISGHGTMNDYEWDWSGTDTRPWKAYQNDIQSVVIESGITSIGNYAFENFDKMSSISIPHNVVSIGNYAFSRCWSLLSIVIPNSVTFIGKSIFRNCTKLEIIVVEEGNPVFDSRNNCNAIVRTSDNELVCGCKQSFIPDNVTSIGEYAFAYSTLRQIEVPNSVTNIGEYAFFSCGFLKSISFGNNLQSIGKCAFNYTSLTSVFIPKSVTDISINLFGGSQDLAEIVVEEGNPVYDSRDNCNAIIRTEDNYLLCGCNKTIIPNSVNWIGFNSFFDFHEISSIIIPNSVKYIEHAFFNCEKLSSVTMGNGIKYIYDGSFDYCPVLSDLYCYAEQVPETDGNAFNYSNIENAVLHVPSASVDSYKNVLPWSGFKNVVAIKPDDPSNVYQSEVEQVGKVRFYSLDGKLLDGPQKGINIIKYDDMTTRKVVIK